MEQMSSAEKFFDSPSCVALSSVSKIRRICRDKNSKYLIIVCSWNFAPCIVIRLAGIAIRSSSIIEKKKRVNIVRDYKQKIQNILYRCQNNDN